MFVNTFWSLVPPIVAIGLALLTKETYSSLFIGIVVGALLATDFSPIGALDTIINDGLTAAIADNAGIFLFLVILGVMVALVNATGGSAAFGRWAASHIHSKAGALLATFALGVLIFIDDYFNCLTVGSVMTPVTDSQKISRVKLAYLIDATAAPICMIAPISSWAAAVSGVAAKLDTGVSGIQLFIEAIPYNFYSLLTIVFVITMVVLGVDYGPMAAAELKAAQTGDLGALSDEHEEGSSRANLWDMLIPIFLLIIFCVIGLIYVGGFWDPESGVAGDFVAPSVTPTHLSVCPGARCSRWSSIIYLCRGVISFKDAMGCASRASTPWSRAILILTFAVSLKSMTGLLGAATMWRAHEGRVRRSLQLLPLSSSSSHACSPSRPARAGAPSASCIPIVLPIFNAAPTADHRHLRMSRRRCLRRPLLPHLRHDHHGIRRRELQPHRACLHADPLRRHRGCHLLCELHPRSVHPQRGHQPRHRRGHGHRHAAGHPLRAEQEGRLSVRLCALLPPIKTLRPIFGRSVFL